MELRMQYQVLLCLMLVVGAVVHLTRPHLDKTVEQAVGETATLKGQVQGRLLLVVAILAVAVAVVTQEQQAALALSS